MDEIEDISEFVVIRGKKSVYFWSNSLRLHDERRQDAEMAKLPMTETHIQFALDWLYGADAE